MDPIFHTTIDYGILLKSLYKSTHTLADFYEFIDSGRPILSRICTEGIPAYEVGHISNGCFKPTSIIVNYKTDKILKTHDILTGRVGGLGCFAQYLDNVPASFSDNTLRLRPKKSEVSRSSFVTAFLNCSIGNTQLLRDSRGGLQKVVTQESLGSIIIPCLGVIEELRLVAELDKARVERDLALAEADRLFTSIDDLVISKLGLPEVSYQKSGAYAIRLGLVKNEKTFSADYFHPERMKAVRQIQSLRNAPLSDLVLFQRNSLKAPGDIKYIGLASISSNTGQLTDARETASGQCFIFKSGDVLYGRLRPYLNKVWLATFDGVCSTEFHVMRPIDAHKLQPEYLAVVMRTSLIVAQTKHMMTGNTHPRLANEDVVNLLLPLADQTTQQEIVTATLECQAEAFRLRTHAEKVWSEARARFEQQLLQGGIA